MDSIIKWFSDALDWLYDVLIYVPKKIFELLLDGLLYVLNAIPVPDFMNNLGNAFTQIPSGVLYFLEIFEVGYGITIIITATLLRFLIRRIPFIG